MVDLCVNHWEGTKATIKQAICDDNIIHECNKECLIESYCDSWPESKYGNNLAWQNHPGDLIGGYPFSFWGNTWIISQHRFRTLTLMYWMPPGQLYWLCGHMFQTHEQFPALKRYYGYLGTDLHAYLLCVSLCACYKSRPRSGPRMRWRDILRDLKSCWSCWSWRGWLVWGSNVNYI